MIFEGEATEQFANGRDLRQGDTLSPILFNLVMENLSQSFHLVEEKKGIGTYVIGGVKSVTHLLFADDILCFSRANQKSLNRIKINTMEEFSVFSILQINVGKSTIILSVSCDRDHVVLQGY